MKDRDALIKLLEAVRAYREALVNQALGHTTGDEKHAVSRARRALFAAESSIAQEFR